MRSYLTAIALFAALGAGYFIMGKSEPTTAPQSASTPPASQVETAISSPASPRRMRASSPPPPAPRRLGSQDEGDQEERRLQREERRRARLAEFDRNGDGELDDKERAVLLQARATRRQERNLEYFDGDGDGEFDADELAMKEQAQQDMRADRAARIIGENDADKNGLISRSEVETSGPRMRRLLQDFDDVDSDGDEQVSAEELQEAMRARRERRGQRGRSIKESTEGE